MIALYNLSFISKINKVNKKSRLFILLEIEFIDSIVNLFVDKGFQEI